MVCGSCHAMESAVLTGLTDSTFRVSRAALLRLRRKSRQFRADSGRSCRVKEKDRFIVLQRAAEKSAALFFGLLPSRRLLFSFHAARDTAFVVVFSPRGPAGAQHQSLSFATQLKQTKYNSAHYGVPNETDMSLPKRSSSICVGFFTPRILTFPRHEIS
jgi:hypothetical protein